MHSSTGMYEYRKLLIAYGYKKGTVHETSSNSQPKGYVHTDTVTNGIATYPDLHSKNNVDSCKTDPQPWLFCVKMK